jgi:hypothetical protein
MTRVCTTRRSSRVGRAFAGPSPSRDGARSPSRRLDVAARRRKAFEPPPEPRSLHARFMKRVVVRAVRPPGLGSPPRSPAASRGRPRGPPSGAPPRGAATPPPPPTASRRAAPRPAAPGRPVLCFGAR